MELNTISRQLKGMLHNYLGASVKFSGVNMWRDLHHFAKNLQSDPSVQHHVYCWVKVDSNLCEVQSVCNPCLIMDYQ